MMRFILIFTSVALKIARAALVPSFEVDAQTCIQVPKVAEKGSFDIDVMLKGGMPDIIPQTELNLELPHLDPGYLRFHGDCPKIKKGDLNIDIETGYVKAPCFHAKKPKVECSKLKFEGSGYAGKSECNKMKLPSFKAEYQPGTIDAEADCTGLKWKLPSLKVSGHLPHCEKPQRVNCEYQLPSFSGGAFDFNVNPCAKDGEVGILFDLHGPTYCQNAMLSFCGHIKYIAACCWKTIKCMCFCG